MEHIPDPLPGKHPEIVIPHFQSHNFPYKYDYTHDFGCWSDFPQRCGWDYNSLCRQDFSYRGVQNDELAAAFLQSWLYFGLLVEFFGKPVTTSDFVRHNAHQQPVITTKRLPEYIADWQRRIESQTPAERKKYLERINNFIRESQIFYYYCDNALELDELEELRPRPPRVPLPDEVLLSIAILHSTLCIAKEKIFKEETQLQLFCSSRIIDERLLENGWCQSDLSWFQDRGGISCLGMYYLSLLGPRPERKSHVSCHIYRCK